MLAWKQAMNEEMDALVSRGTWELVSAPTYAIIMGCRWVYTLKYRPDGSVIAIRPDSWPKVILKRMV